MKTLRKIVVPVAVIWFAALLIAGFLAYFVTFKGVNGATDGLGRSLSETPAAVRFIFGQERMWAGWIWFLVDMLIFWGSVLMTVKVSRRLQD